MEENFHGRVTTHQWEKERQRTVVERSVTVALNMLKDSVEEGFGAEGPGANAWPEPWKKPAQVHRRGAGRLWCRSRFLKSSGQAVPMQMTIDVNFWKVWVQEVFGAEGSSADIEVRFRKVSILRWGFGSFRC